MNEKESEGSLSQFSRLGHARHYSWCPVDVCGRVACAYRDALLLNWQGHDDGVVASLVVSQGP